ncbi:hypothetical protein RFI_27275, partial [Reticulomyxa filosa]
QQQQQQQQEEQEQHNPLESVHFEALVPRNPSSCVLFYNAVLGNREPGKKITQWSLNGLWDEEDGSSFLSCPLFLQQDDCLHNRDASSELQSAVVKVTNIAFMFHYARFLRAKRQWKAARTQHHQAIQSAQEVAKFFDPLIRAWEPNIQRIQQGYPSLKQDIADLQLHPRVRRHRQKPNQGDDDEVKMET